MQSQDPSSLTATLSVTINQFRPLGGVFPISYTMSLVQASSGITASGADITITSSQPANLTFQIATAGYIFVGATVDADTAGTDVGSCEFPDVSITRAASGSSLTLDDANLSNDQGTIYNYILLVQNTATGEIGIIDPNIIAEPR